MYISKEIEFDAAHRLPSYKGKCKCIHGHRWKLKVYVSGVVNKDDNNEYNGMIMDYNVIKSVLNEEVDNIFDHSLTLYYKDKYLPQFKEMFSIAEDVEFTESMQLINYPLCRFNIVNFVPTSENLCKYLFLTLYKKFLSKDINLNRIELNETPTSMATYTFDDYEFDFLAIKA